jgi:hypothetical protein
MNQLRTLARKAHSLSWLCYWMDLQVLTSISASGIYTSRRHIAQTVPQVQPASCLMATGGSFPGAEAAGAFTWQLFPIRIKNSCSQIAFPETHLHGTVPNYYTEQLIREEVLSSPKCPHLNWGPSNNACNYYYVSLSGIKRPEPGKDYPFPYRVEIKHSCSFTSASLWYGTESAHKHICSGKMLFSPRQYPRPPVGSTQPHTQQLPSFFLWVKEAGACYWPLISTQRWVGGGC